MGRAVALDTTRAACRRPILAGEIPSLEALGRRLRELRRRTGLSQAALARAAQLNGATISRVEAGTRRTRRSTLERIASALVAELPDLGDADRLTDDLAALAGPALAPESAYADRVARRRKRRHRKREQTAEGERKGQIRELLVELDREAKQIAADLGPAYEYAFDDDLGGCHPVAT